MPLSDRREPLVSYWESLQPQERGVVIFVLWLNALASTVLAGAQLVLLLRVLLRVRRDHDFVRAAQHLVVSPSFVAVLTATAIHRLGRDLWIRQQSRAAGTRRQSEDR